jgi:hypothetical protein
MGFRLLQAGQLQARVVVVVEVVDADYLVAAREQNLGDMHADETGRAGDENFHIVHPLMSWKTPAF